MRILFLTHSFNSLAQRLYAELAARAHVLSVEFDINDSVTEEAVELFRPDILIAPFLKRAIPESVWNRIRCLVVHPGIPGDRGPSSLDWAIHEGERDWGVTVLQANGEMDAGEILAAADFPMRGAAKASLYRHEVTGAAVRAVLEAIERIENPAARGKWPAPAHRGRKRGAMLQADRAIDWAREVSAAILRKIRAADGFPGVRDSLYGESFYLYDAHPEPALRGGAPGAIIARRGGAILRATVDGAIWIGHLKRHSERETTFKLPAVIALGPRAADIPEANAPLWDPHASGTYRDLYYDERDGAGYVHFPFYNGAMSTGQCERLCEALRFARTRPTLVIVLMGGPDFWCNGIHLNVIEAAEAPAEESWANINAIDDVAREILACDRHLTIAALQGNAGAGGVFLALAADRVMARSGVVLNPHYKGMGNLYGSEYWTYSLPRRVGQERAEAIMQSRLPLTAAQAAQAGLIDQAVDADAPGFLRCAEQAARSLAAAPDLAERIAAKNRERATLDKPLEQYRAEELARMRLNFFGFDPSYHVARYNFVFKVPRSRTPPYLAAHRRRGGQVTCGHAASPELTGAAP